MRGIDHLPNWQFDSMAGWYDWISLSRDLDAIGTYYDADRPLRLLDLGGGTGEFLRHAIDHGLADSETSVVADYSQPMLVNARTKGLTKTVRSDAHDLPFNDEGFDAVFMGDTLHHMAEPCEVLGEVNRILRSDGYLLLEEFDPSRFLGRLIYLGEQLFGLKSKFMRPKILRERLEETGFSDVTLHSDGYRYLLGGRKP